MKYARIRANQFINSLSLLQITSLNIDCTLTHERTLTHYVLIYTYTQLYHTHPPYTSDSQTHTHTHTCANKLVPNIVMVIRFNDLELIDRRVPLTRVRPLD